MTTMHRIELCRNVLLVLLTACAAHAGSRIFIVTDMEGVGGVNNADEQLLPGQRRYDESRHLLTGELNAAIQGAIDSRARLIQGRPTPANYYLSDRAYDGILFVGQHAMAGAKGGVLAHSQSFSVEKITINGRAVGGTG